VAVIFLKSILCSYTCMMFSPDDVQQIDSLRFNVILRMLKSEHFNARMNALKEVGSGRYFSEKHFMFLYLYDVF